MSKYFMRIFAVLVTLTLTISLLPSLKVNAYVVDSGTCGDNLFWSLDSKGTLEISGAGDMFNYDDNKNEAPWLEDHRHSIVGVTIKEGVTSIGSLAFYDCPNLNTVSISDSVTSIGGSAFSSCTGLRSIDIPDNVTLIGRSVFSFCTNLESVRIPDEASLEGATFFKCTSLKTVSIPNSATSINDQEFCFCESLETISIPDGVTSIGRSAFSYCKSLKSITLPNSVTSIGDEAFNNCENLETVTLSNSTDWIGSSAFDSCKSLETISIPDSVTSIGEFAFSNCTSLKSVNLSEGVTFIGEKAFLLCTSLDTISIPNSVTTIGSEAFHGCIFKSITIPENINSLYGVFFECSKLENVTFLDGITSIDAMAFSGCSSLKSVLIPESVTSIGYCSFGRCTSLESVVLSKNCLVDKNAFSDCNSGLKYYYYYDVTYKTSGKGEVTGKARSYFGDEFTITSDPYFVLKEIKYVNETGSEGTISADAENKYYMPDSDSPLTVTVTFERIKADVNFLSEDGETVLQPTTTYDVGSTPLYTGTEPYKNPDEHYTYSFAGWTDGTNTYGPDDDLPPVTDNIDYKAVFESTTNKYTIEFVDESGKVLQSESIEYGTTPSYQGTTPVKAEDDKYTYEFSGWSPAIASVTSDATYKAVFTSTAKPTPFIKPGTYYLKSMVEQDGNIIFTIKQSEDDTKTFDLLGTVSSDGTKLTAGDQYTAEKGSAIITVKKSYLDTLTAGNHKLTVTFTDGGTITITYEVKAPTPAPEAKPAETKAAAVTTGEVIAVTTVAGSVMLIVSCGIVLSVLLRRRRENR